MVDVTDRRSVLTALCAGGAATVGFSAWASDPDADADAGVEGSCGTVERRENRSASASPSLARRPLPYDFHAANNGVDPATLDVRVVRPDDGRVVHRNRLGLAGLNGAATAPASVTGRLPVSGSGYRVVAVRSGDATAETRVRVTADGVAPEEAAVVSVAPDGRLTVDRVYG